MSSTPADERSQALELVGLLLSSLSPPVTDAELDAAAGRRDSPEEVARPEPVEVWHQQPDESLKAFAAFCLYRDGAPGNSIREVAAELGKRRQLLERWSTRHRWVARVDAYLRALDLHHLALASAPREHKRELRSTQSHGDNESARRQARRSKSARRMRPPGSHRFVPLASLNDPSHPAFRQPATPPAETGADEVPDAGLRDGSHEAVELAWPPRDSAGQILPEYWEQIRRLVSQQGRRSSG